jgi:hypothetical protein
MTCEWLTGHSHAVLAKHSIAVLNGVSQRSVRHTEQAELVLRGRCGAIARVRRTLRGRAHLRSGPSGASVTRHNSRG